MELRALRRKDLAAIILQACRRVLVCRIGDVLHKERPYGREAAFVNLKLGVIRDGDLHGILRKCRSINRSHAAYKCNKDCGNQQDRHYNLSRLAKMIDFFDSICVHQKASICKT